MQTVVTRLPCQSPAHTDEAGHSIPADDECVTCGSLRCRAHLFVIAGFVGVRCEPCVDRVVAAIADVAPEESIVAVAES